MVWGRRGTITTRHYPEKNREIHKSVKSVIQTLAGSSARFFGWGDSAGLGMVLESRLEGGKTLRDGAKWFFLW